MSKHDTRGKVARAMRNLTGTTYTTHTPRHDAVGIPFKDTYRHVMQETRRSKSPHVWVARKWHRHTCESVKVAVLYMRYRYDKLKVGHTPKVFDRWVYDNRKAYPYITPHLREQTVERLIAWNVKGI